MRAGTRVGIAFGASAVLLVVVVGVALGWAAGAPRPTPGSPPGPRRAKEPSALETRSAAVAVTEEGELAALRERTRQQAEEIGHLRRRTSELEAAAMGLRGASVRPAPDFASLSMLMQGSAVFGPGDEALEARLNQAAAALEGLGDAGKELLLAEVEHADPARRAVAVLVAARLDGEELVEPVARSALGDGDREVRKAAARALAAMNCPSAADRLLEVLDSPAADPAVRLSVWSGLARLGREEAWTSLETMLATVDGEAGEVTREMVVEAALEHDDRRLREPLQLLLADERLAEPVRARVRGKLEDGRN